MRAVWLDTLGDRYVQWHRWERSWAVETTRTRLPPGRQLIYHRNDEGTEFLQVVDLDYELRDEEYYMNEFLDDQEEDVTQPPTEAGGDDEDEDEDENAQIFEVIAKCLDWLSERDSVLWMALYYHADDDGDHLDYFEDGHTYPVTPKRCCIRSIIISNRENMPFAMPWHALGVLGGNVFLDGTFYNEENCFEKALSLQPAYSWSWCCLGGLGGGTVNGESLTATDCFLKAALLDPDHPEYFEKLLEMNVPVVDFGGVEHSPLELAIFLVAWEKNDPEAMIHRRTLEHVVRGLELDSGNDLDIKKYLQHRIRRTS